MKVKIFRNDYAGPQATERLERDINIWLDDIEPQIRSVSQTDTGAKIGLTICVWYKEKEKYKYGRDKRDNYTGDKGLAETFGHNDINSGDTNLSS